MNKLKLSLFTLLVLFGCILPASAQQNFLALASIFTAANQSISSNSSGLPVVVPPGGVLGVGNGIETLAGAGTAQGDAAALSSTAFLHRITGANGTVGWRFAATTVTSAAICHFLLNTTAGVALVYPATGGTINGAATNAVFTALTGIKPIICCASATDTWSCA